MTDDILVDTNVLVYAYDRAAGTKQARAVDTLSRVLRTGRGRLSTQVLGEFFRVATQRLAAPLTIGDACDQIARLLEAWPVLAITPPIVLEAARGVRDHRLPFWDAQLWATARLNQVEIVLSEDFTDGRTLEGVRFMNPFAPSFDVATLG
jgi:predicted nucleic acid-binding protein